MEENKMENHKTSALIIFLFINFPIFHCSCENCKYKYENFTILANKYGHNTEEHSVLTEDGYILKLFRIPGNSSRPVLMIHGIFGTSENFIARGKSSLAITLADAGYDVWAANCRGNWHTKHINLDTENRKFWDFSFHEIGYYDFPAFIDHILKITGRHKLNVIGHSQGNTIAYVLGSTNEQYNKKINVFIALAPVAYMNDLPAPLPILFELWSLADVILDSQEKYGLYNKGSDERNFLGSMCTENFPNNKYEICMRLLFELMGFDYKELEASFSTISFSQFPNGSSKKSIMHYVQVARNRKFSYYDYGTFKNLEIYKTMEPPLYDLNKVTMPIALVVAENDKLSTIKNVNNLYNLLPNIVDYHIIERKEINHVDFVWGRNMKEYLYPHIFKVLEKII